MGLNILCTREKIYSVTVEIIPRETCYRYSWITLVFFPISPNVNVVGNKLLSSFPFPCPLSSFQS